MDNERSTFKMGAIFCHESFVCLPVSGLSDDINEGQGDTDTSSERVMMVIFYG